MKQLKITRLITDRSDGGSIDNYFQDLSRLETSYSHEEEIELAKKIKEGDTVARDKLTKANLRFVVSVAKQYQNQGMPLPDLVSEGNIGLMKAVQKFDHTKGFKFISYAVWWIRQSILQALAKQSRIVRLPLNKVGDITKMNKVISDLEQKLERAPGPYDIASVMDNMDENDVSKMMSMTGKNISLDAPLPDDNNSKTADVFQDKKADMPDDGVMQESIEEELYRVLGLLKQREADILILHFGLNGHMTLSEMADNFFIKPERVRQIKEKALRKLRKNSKKLSLLLS